MKVSREMKSFIEKIKNNSYWVILLASSFALIIAYFSQYFLGFMPCSLCLLQRIPYAILVLISIIFILKPKRRNLNSLVIIAFCLIELGLAIYHVGIEHYIFEESAVCQLNFDPNQLTSCNQVYFRFMNLSMAEWNLFYILALLYYFCKQETKYGLWKA